MAEAIFKLQPNRTLALRGFDDRGAGAAIHAATDNGFQVSGIFRDTADFCVLFLYDADNFYEHPRLKYLPSFDFSGMILQFDVAYTNLMPLDSAKFPSIDWPFLDVVRADGATAQVRLFEHASQIGGSYLKASTGVTVIESGVQQFDSVTVWFQNFAFQFFVPLMTASKIFTGTGVLGTPHTLTIAGTTYTYLEQLGDTNTDVAAGVAAAAAGNTYVTIAQLGNQLDMTASRDDGAAFVVEATTITGSGSKSVAAGVVQLINQAKFGLGEAIEAVASGSNITIRARKPGRDGNMLAVYVEASAPSRLNITGGGKLSGGSSDATWRVRLDFNALGLTEIRQMWLTFAPALADSSAYVAQEWQANFTNWTVSGDNKWLKVAGPGSVRIEEADSWCTYSGSSWVTVDSREGFYSKGFARRVTSPGDGVRVRYHSQHVHDLYLGTSLYGDRGSFGVSLDGDPATLLDTRLLLNGAPVTDAQVNTRRLLRANVPPGEHEVSLTNEGGGPVYFDFIEAAVLSDVPDAPGPWLHRCPANDYGTDHTYKLPAARLMWILEKLGFAGPMNVYVSVFWWNNRKREGAILPSATVIFSGNFRPAEAPYVADQVFVNIGGQAFGKTVFAGEGPATIAQHFAYFINGSSVGVWASAVGASLTITSRAVGPAFEFPLSAQVDSDPGRGPGFESTGAAVVLGSLTGSEPGLWVIDPDQADTINRGTREWLRDLLGECSARGREIVLAYSMELLNPPESWAARYPNGDAVFTATGFSTNVTTHCSFTSGILAYQKRVFLETANLMAAAGVPVELQMGEFVWWYFNNNSPPTADPGGDPAKGMAYYDAETMAEFQVLYGRPLARFAFPDSDPSINNYEDANFLRSQLVGYMAALRAHVKASHPGASLEILLPLDVNYPAQYGPFVLGGRLNHHVNIPEEFRSPATAPFDRVKMEGLDFGAGSRDLDKALRCMRFPYAEMAWPKNKCRYLIAVFNGGCPWEREYRQAVDEAIPAVNYWAFDHVCIQGWRVEEPPERETAAVV